MVIVSSGNQPWAMKQTFISLKKASLQKDLIDQNCKIKGKIKINLLSTG